MAKELNIILCIESSHSKGMGHFFRSLEFYKFLKTRNIQPIVAINNHAKSINLLNQQGIPYHTVEFSSSDWELPLIQKYNPNVWWNDRLETSIDHNLYLVNNQVRIVTLDDYGEGADLADLNILGLYTHGETKGKKKLIGTDYLILNSEIDKYKKLRKGRPSKILLTLGGSDTYGVTLKVLKFLKNSEILADILIGPGFEHTDLLNLLAEPEYKIFSSVPSMIKLLSNYDLAITGGGITPFEANASGLPCYIIANEVHEIPTGKFLEDNGGCIFLGYHTDIDFTRFDRDLSLEAMSRIGMDSFNTQACNKIYNEIAIL